LSKRIRFGSLRRLKPLSRRWGSDRGTPIDRYYIDGFLAKNAMHIHGSVLEVKDRRYTERFGADRVSASEVLDIRPENSAATIVADIMQAGAIEAGRFDCVIFTQTLQFVREPKRALDTLHTILKPGGVLLLTCPGITPIAITGPAAEWYWSFTPVSLEMLLSERFGPESVIQEAQGNVFAASCFLWGIAQEEISSEELDHHDARYPVILTACARKC